MSLEEELLAVPEDDTCHAGQHGEKTGLVWEQKWREANAQPRASTQVPEEKGGRAEETADRLV